MAGTSDLVVAGFGSWATTTKLITKGYAIASPTPPADGGLEWLLDNNRLEWLPDGPNRLEYLLDNTRLEWITEAPNG